MISNFKTPKAMRIEFTNGESIMENILGISMDDTWVTYMYIDDDEDLHSRSIKANEVKEILLLEPAKKKEQKVDEIVKEMDRMYNEMFGDLM